MGRKKAVYKETYQVTLKNGKKVRRETKHWYIRWTDAQGRRRKMKAGMTFEQSKAVLSAKLAEVAAAKAGMPTQDLRELALDSLLNKFLAARKPHITPDHYKDIESSLRRTFKTMQVDFVKDVTRERVESYLNSLAESGAAPRTVNKTLVFLKSLFNWGVKVGEIHANPIPFVSSRPQYEKRRKRRVFTSDEIRRILNACDTGWLRISILFGLYAGLRVGDMRRLLWCNVDLIRNEINIRPEAEKNRKGACLPIHPVLKEALVEWRKETLPGPGAHVVHIPTRPVENFRTVLKRAEIPYIDEAGAQGDLHALRHTFLSNLSRAGAGMKEVQSLGRHSDLKVTGIYLHSSKDRNAQAVALLPDYIGSEDDAVSVAQESGKSAISQPERADSERAREDDSRKHLDDSRLQKVPPGLQIQCGVIQKPRVSSILMHSRQPFFGEPSRDDDSISK